MAPMNGPYVNNCSDGRRTKTRTSSQPSRTRDGCARLLARLVWHAKWKSHCKTVHRSEEVHRMNPWQGPESRSTIASLVGQRPRIPPDCEQTGLSIGLVSTTVWSGAGAVGQVHATRRVVIGVSRGGDDKGPVSGTYTLQSITRRAIDSPLGQCC
ncbi:hypothetical protein RRG08_043063 [Elysia crispata]|uniref:Uncharacterized protein n=1 Tax=Elysia crispata TaxID=231223 RepID=A0AAE1CPS4_9GAST|nr:hypothetical protein RRG08_043063 [Elysia crispata]